MSRFLPILLLLVTALGAQRRDGIVKRDLILAPNEVDYQSSVRVPRGYAVIVGVSRYANLPAEAQLRFSESDARNVYQTVISREGGQIEPENVKTLFGADATKANITKAIEEWLPSVAQEDDRVIVFFAGHGFVYQGKGYLAPYDFSFEHTADTGYDMARLGDVLANKVKARNKILLTDACHSAKILPGLSSKQINDQFKMLPGNFFTLASSREAESSYEDPDLANGSGVFAYFLVQGWKGQADVDPEDGIVTADELVQYVRSQVRQYVKARGNSQNPQESGNFPADMTLGFLPQRREKVKNNAAPAKDGTIIVTTNLEDVEVYVDGNRIGKVGASKKLVIPGLSNGEHEVRGERQGYDPALRMVTVRPGQEITVDLRIQFQRRIGEAAKQEFQKGQAIYARRKSSAELQSAAEDFKKALKLEPKYSEAAEYLCLTEQVLGHTMEAVKACKKAVELTPDGTEFRTYYASVLTEMGDSSEAIRQLTSVLERDPKRAEAYVMLGDAYLFAQDFQKSEAAATKALELNPKDARAYLFRGDARRFQERYPEAMGDYLSYLRINDFRAPVNEVLGYYLIGSGLSKRNVGQKKVHEIQQWSAWFGVCDAARGMDEYAKAISACDRALKLDAKDAGTYYLLGKTYTEWFDQKNTRQNLLKAEENIAMALRLNPDFEFAKEAKRQLVAIRELKGVVK
ncbi:caspase family protein [Bryobacter aggregatus]|uniref:caspase family protein n=1 Tax=Bryobacter aggregatus TaxID=360054 RepID=UPI0004E0EDDE|nr:tetratricopeptide repeat protein [Bryobacter aggregatus]